MPEIAQYTGYARGLSYIFIWYSSILLGFFFLYAPLIPLLFIHRPSYRRATDLLFSTWEAFNTTVLELVYGVEIVLTGDAIRPTDDALMVLNHPTRMDWNFVWSAIFHASNYHNTKIVLKEPLRRVPGMGWIMAMSRFIFLQRRWSEDSCTFDRMMQYYNETREADGARQILLFPEGTNMAPSARQKSDLYAVENNVAKYKHLLHPRTSGFVHLAYGLREKNLLSSVYDLTIAYPDIVPTSEMDLVRGKIPRRVHVHVARYPVQQVPSTYVGLEKWIQEIWRDKEKLLERFAATKEFIPISQEQRFPVRMKTLQPLCLVFWSLFLYWSLSTLLYSLAAKLWVLLVAGMFYYTEKKTGGIQQLELSLHTGSFWNSGKRRYRSSDEDAQDDFEHVKDD